MESFCCRHTVITTRETAVCQSSRVKCNSTPNHICSCVQSLIEFFSCLKFPCMYCKSWRTTLCGCAQSKAISFGGWCNKIRMCVALWLAVYHFEWTWLYPCTGQSLPHGDHKVWQRHSCFGVETTSAFFTVCIWLFVWVSVFMRQEDSGYDLPPCYFLSGTNQLTALLYTVQEQKCFISTAFGCFSIYSPGKRPERQDLFRLTDLLRNLSPLSS